ncbi:VOC family protein [Mycobacterium sp. URHB0044]|uniref:VOC family protein n=1 Tax=Mycobacterium sp. URHB0044 TaxID=1380386 RepID=UPI00055E55FA|nr:VOC family protein [Mycobacterium sp. URHB0044]
MADGQAGVGLDTQFSHVVIAVSDMDRALAFYRDVLGMDIVFDQEFTGDPFTGRAVGGLVGGASIELLYAPTQVSDERTGSSYKPVGMQVLSFSVPDLDQAYAALEAAVGDRVQQPFDVEDVRMFFVTDPDGTVLEFVEFPGGARNPAELHRVVPDGEA